MVYTALEDERQRASKAGAGAKSKDRRVTLTSAEPSSIVPPSTPSTTSIVKVYQYTQSDLRQKLELAVQSGHTVLIEGVSANIEPWLDTILSKQVSLLTLLLCYCCVTDLRLCIADLPFWASNGHSDM